MENEQLKKLLQDEEEKCLLPKNESDMEEIKKKDPQIIFERMKDLMSELIYLSDVVEDEQFEQNQDAL